MPLLPTVTVTQAQADRILVAFGVDQATAVIAYKEWLVKSLREYVIAKTTQQLVEARAASEASTYASVLADLPPEPAPGGAP